MKCKIYEQKTDCININILDQDCLICKCQKPHSGKILRGELLVLWRWAGMCSGRKHWRCWDVRVTCAKSRPGEQSEGQGCRTKVRLQKEGKIRPEYERMDIPWEMGHVPSISLPWVGFLASPASPLWFLLSVMTLALVPSFSGWPRSGAPITLPLPLVPLACWCH